VTFGEEKAMKSVKVQFLVVDYPSLYNCIIGRTRAGYTGQGPWVDPFNPQPM
ncbi:hypothetical protein A2U01_0096160, partial [Trifolium medium]|nr:hypothetical protein [Trifolium medium]